jgi:Na+/H+ antiporter NhaD/arsenite permease-like protein
MVAELAVLTLTVVLISLRRLVGIPIERAAAALFGAALMMVLGYVPLASFADAVDWPTILLLLGMLLIAAVLEGTGLFSWVASRVVTRARTPWGLMVGVLVVTAILSALVLNDAVVLFFTPVVLAACRRLGRDPVGYLVAEAIGANIGSLATPVGNPQNAWIATHAGLSLTDFVATMTPPALIALTAAALVLRFVFRRELGRPFDGPASPDAPEGVPRRPMYGAIGLAIFAVALALGSLWQVPVAAVALVVGSLFLFAAPLVGIGTGRQHLRRVDWTVLLLFIGLFIVLAGVRDNDTFVALLGLLPATYGDPGSLFVLAGVTAVLSNLVSNVPAVLLIGHGLPMEPTAFYVLAASSTLAGNATLVGAAANLLVAERAEEGGASLPFGRFVAAGLPIALVSIAAAVAWIAFT